MAIIFLWFHSLSNHHTSPYLFIPSVQFYILLECNISANHANESSWTNAFNCLQSQRRWYITALWLAARAASKAYASLHCNIILALVDHIWCHTVNHWSPYICWNFSLGTRMGRDCCYGDDKNALCLHEKNSLGGECSKCQKVETVICNEYSLLMIIFKNYYLSLQYYLIFVS
jgi:hypothetical protein